MRIVSLLPSATEIVAVLGLMDCLVGRSHECDYPAGVTALPVCTSAKFKLQGTSAQIDRDVKALLQNTLSVYQVDVPLLRELRPDVIVTQAQCEVCAVSLRDVEAAVREGLAPGTRIASLKAQDLAGIWEDIRHVGAVLGREAAAETWLREARQRVATIADRTRGLAGRPRVACIEWLEPLMAGGNWMPELIEMAGGENLFGEAGRHSPWIEWEAVRAADPDVLLILPCGFDLARNREEMPALRRLSGWHDLRAVREGRVYGIDGNQYCNRPGPRIVESLEIIAEILNPELFGFGHRQTAWIENFV